MTRLAAEGRRDRPRSQLARQLACQQQQQLLPPPQLAALASSSTFSSTATAASACSSSSSSPPTLVAAATSAHLRRPVPAARHVPRPAWRRPAARLSAAGERRPAPPAAAASPVAAGPSPAASAPRAALPAAPVATTAAAVAAAASNKRKCGNKASTFGFNYTLLLGPAGESSGLALGNGPLGRPSSGPEAHTGTPWKKTNYSPAWLG
ncbi:non-canonical polyA RNA polymerase PAPD5 [Crotalus adamanteus]|uniref:Non-canonical polyA RNA polymerase PAPD5 n=1 Tax=Crotalus adamanteus TaxID=8729 RepID=A0AAW1CAI0_CROAD